jgi:potassium channel
MFGDVSGLCNIPHPFAHAAQLKLSQLLIIRKTKLTEIMHEHNEDSNIVMTNLLKV